MFALIDGYIHRHNHDRTKQSFGWMSPVQYRLSHGLAV
ncbi:IS3 family transposase [Bifidobacterium longum subsp. infantis]|nr:IS3 family transposase [Bifidobacterium longum]UOG10416.1 IS3 family transposase [Bifidobacterium longum subsp. infantis]